MKQKNKKISNISYRYRRKTLKGRLNKSLSVTSFISVMISLISVLLIIFLIINPIGYYLTDSISSKIHKNYLIYDSINNDNQSVLKNEELEKIRKSNFDEMSELDRIYGNTESDIAIDDGKYNNIIFNNIMKLNFDEIIKKSENEFKPFDSTKIKLIRKDLIESEKSEIKIKGDLITNVTISDTEKKLILASTYLALNDIDHFLALGETIGINWVNIRLEVNNEEIFKIPRNYDLENATYTEKKFSDLHSSIPIVDRHGKIVGELITSLNTSTLMIVFIPIVILFILIAGMTLFIVKILILPLTTTILKPINILNKELKKIAEHDLIECEDIKIEQKKPPTEIRKLIDYSNTIIAKLQFSHHTLENQRDELESQNAELDAQKDELSAQNNELMTSQEKLRKAQGQLVQSEKLASMGQLTAAIMHEINTPLGAVHSNNQMNAMMLDKLSIKLEENDYDGALKVIEKLRRSSKTTDDATKRVGEIIKNLKNFSRIDQAKFQNADITEGIKSVLVLTSNLWKNKVIIHESYEMLPLIRCYPSMLNQVFMNIIVNAIQASDKNDDIYIQTEFDDVYVYLTIRDNGSGIKKNHLEHIFDSGFTTKPKDEGTGLGLSISKDIIDKHCGYIEAFNNDDKGTTFKITLPIEQSDKICKESGQ